MIMGHYVVTNLKSYPELGQRCKTSGTIDICILVSNFTEPYFIVAYFMNVNLFLSEDIGCIYAKLFARTAILKC